jgi:uncharacterized protein (DUF1800 family)
VPWTEAHVRRLLWRAGFGPRPGEAGRWAERGREATVAWLVRGGSRTLAGPEPSVEGRPLDPVNEWGHDVLWWLDRMVRTDRPLEEKLTLFWHDHFATRDQDTPLMLAQNRTQRRHALGRFDRLLAAMTLDPAMQLFLSLADSHKDHPNENYARELLELFTLGGRGYGERDVRESARALTGFRARWRDGNLAAIRFDRSAYDAGTKRILGARGRFGWRDVLRLATSHPRHAPFLVEKLWSYFVTEPLDRATRRQLVAAYRGSRLGIRPVVERILVHPALYADLDRPDMVKAPVVFVAGMLRGAGMPVDRPDWAWLLDGMGQELFSPPSVAGWEWGPAWLSTNTVKARFNAATRLLRNSPLAVPDGSVPTGLPVAEQLARARAAVGDPWTSPETDAALARMGDAFMAGLDPRREWRVRQRSEHLQRTLRHYLLAGPDAQLH